MLNTKVIPIECGKEHKKEAQNLKKIIESNPLLFQIFLAEYTKISFFDSEDESVLEITSIDNFKSLLSIVIPSYMEMLKTRVYTEGGEDIDTVFLKMILLDVISSKENNSLDKSYIEELSLNINTIYSIVALSYYQEKDIPERIIDFIFNPSSAEKEKIYKWLNEKERYNLMNLLLAEEYQKVLELEELESDSYLRTHLEELLDLSEIDIIKKFAEKKEKTPNLPKITKEELDKLCIEFFIKIDPSLKWLKLYNELKSKKTILYGEKFPDPCSDWGCLETTDDIYIYAPLDGTIRDFMYFVHEFSHFITLTHKKQGEFIPSALQEFPPIFFERCATSFLKGKGYNHKKVTALEEERTAATLGNMSDISPSLRYLTQYINSGPITYQTEKEKMDRIRKSIPDDLPDEMKDLINDLMSTKEEANVNIKIDAENAFLIEHPNCIFEEYPYVLGTHLADKVLEQISANPLLIYTVLEITENLTREKTETVIQKLGLESEGHNLNLPTTNYVKKHTK